MFGRFINFSRNKMSNLHQKIEKITERLDKKFSQWGEGSEYGVQFKRLCKDDSEVKILEE